ncbi:MAG: ribosome biogenesis GTPase Der [Candidatus Berkelbacteria bacterium]|nr:ribosome biogenesis GTPase Der [Candidatus Berkelbacteria bacterium]
MKNLPIVSIIGRPNVGKSTLFNRLVGERRAITSHKPGTTRDLVAEKVEWEGKGFILVDTAGFLTDYYGISEQEIEKKAQDQIDAALEGSDLVLFVVDAKEGLTARDMQVAKRLRKLSDKIILVFNKTDNMRAEELVRASRDVGFRQKMAVSAISGRRSGNLLDLITSRLPLAEVEKKALTRVAIVGRPNVGKSTLFNALVGFERAIVSDIPGTTRDSIKYEVRLGNRSRSFEFIDTAGFRRRGKITPGVEKYSVLRSVGAIISSDVVLILADASEGLTRGEAHLAQLALQNNKKVVLVLNKIDLLKEKSADEIANISRFEFLSRLPAVAISAKSKENLNLLVRELMKI